LNCWTKNYLSASIYWSW